MARVKRVPPAAILAVLALVGILIALLTAAPPGVTQRSSARPSAPVELKAGLRCFGLPSLPDDTRYVRLVAEPGSHLPRSVSISIEDGVILKTGGPTWRGGDQHFVEYRLSAPVEGNHTVQQICLDSPKGGSTVLGEPPVPAITLLGASHGNWLAALPTLAERASFGRGTLLGKATLPLALLLLGAAWLLAVREASTTMRSSEPIGRRSVVRLGVVGGLFCAAFALTTPPLQSPDEMVHVQYVELLADQHQVPQTTELRGDATSPQLKAVIGLAATGRAAFSPDRRTPWGTIEDHRADAELAKLPSGGAVDSFTNSSSQPPAYYAVLATATSITGGSVFDRMLVGRLLSALMVGIAIAGCAAFAREAVPRARGLVVAGAILVATLPVVGFIGGSINPDALLIAVSAWTLVVIAKILRQGPTARRGLALGALVGLGLISKLTYAGLLPAVALAAIVVLVRGYRSRELRTALISVGAALGVVAVLAAPYLLWAVLSGRGISFGPPPPPGAPPGPVQTLRETLVYSVELYAGQFGPLLDRIPGSGPWDIWISGLTGSLGWVDYGLPHRWVKPLGLYWGLLAVLALVGILRSARARRAIPVDAVVYAVAVAGLALLIARAGLTARLGGAVGFEQARYLFPVAAIGAAGVALGLRQLPKAVVRDWAAAVVVVIALIDGTALYFMTIGRYFA